jgi:hypothetical protein
MADSRAPAPCCNLCGGAVDGGAACAVCGGSALDRMARDGLSGLPLGLLDWRQARLPAALPGLNRQWFRPDAGSGAPADFIAAVLAPAAADDAAATAPAETPAVAAAMAALSARGVAYFIGAAADGAPPRQRLDLMLQRLADLPMACSVLAFDQQDPCGAARRPGWLLFRSDQDAALWLRHLLAWNPALQPASGGIADPFAPLRAELAEWQAARADCTLWWRDDDLVRSGEALTRLAAMSQRYRAPVLMAVIPQRADPALARDTAALPTLSFCQHGWGHVNHAPEGAPKSEFGAERAPAVARAELERGHARMRELFGARFMPVLVPPWNSLADPLVAALPAIGLYGLSQYYGLPHAAAGGVQRVDTHIDIVDWRVKAGVHAPAMLAERLAAMLRARRHGALDEPVGILSHHYAMAEGSWHFLGQLHAVLAEFSCVRWLSPQQVFGDALARQRAASCAA